MALSKEKEYRKFAADENDRHIAYNRLCSALLSYHLEDQPEPWPSQSLPEIADVTLSDGAAFAFSQPDGRLEFKQMPDGSKGRGVTVAQVGKHGSMWEYCQRSPDWRQEDCQFIRESLMNSETIGEYGLNLPPGSSMMVYPIASFCQSSWVLMIWRTPGAEGKHSRDPYHEFDRLWCRLCSRFVGMSLDLREHVKQTTRLQCIQDSMRAILEVVTPILLDLHQVAKTAPKAFSVRLERDLLALDKALENVQRSLFLSGHDGGVR